MMRGLCQPGSGQDSFRSRNALRQALAILTAARKRCITDGEDDTRSTEPRAVMTLEVDHVFICTSPFAPEADRLVQFGLTEGMPNQHPGQGTACRRFFFRNAYLELVWVENAAEARSSLVRRTGLWERWSR